MSKYANSLIVSCWGDFKKFQKEVTITANSCMDLFFKISDAYNLHF